MTKGFIDKQLPKLCTLLPLETIALVPEKIKTAADFVKMYFIDNNRPKTYYMHNGEKETQCISGARRSLLDLLFIAKHYVPEVTMEELIYELLVTSKRVNGESIKVICLNYCRDVHKIVFGSCIVDNGTTDVKLLHGFKMFGMDKNGLLVRTGNCHSDRLYFTDSSAKYNNKDGSPEYMPIDGMTQDMIMAMANSYLQKNNINLREVLLEDRLKYKI